ncbi:transposase [Aeromonas enteropelogenes]|uniref:transposase n=1 Tax=Aeromonas enteropelogenes TaxID=29489 RepID=UPI003985BC3B
MFEFLKGYGAEAQCENVLFTWRFPHGFVCHELCQQDLLSPEKRPLVWQCNHCRHQMSFTGNTIFANTKLSLTK